MSESVTRKTSFGRHLGGGLAPDMQKTPSRKEPRKGTGAPTVEPEEGGIPMTMGMLLIILLVVALLAMGGWGYSHYARPAPATREVVVEPAAGPSPIITIIGVLGLLALVVFFVLWAVEGWRFNFEAIPPR